MPPNLLLCGRHEKVVQSKMSLLSPPQIPLFRITLFYGPEAVKGASNSLHCVFNVKKRSWKGGVQVEVVVDRHQIRRLEERLQFVDWMQAILDDLPVEERTYYWKNGQDLLVQLICFHKLQIYIEQGIRQENSHIAGDLFVDQIDEVIQRESERIKQKIVEELDIELTKN